MNDIEKIYDMLNWNNPRQVQDMGIELAREITDLSLLIQPPAAASVWEHCANILYEKSDEELEPYLDLLLEWLRDLNWPGALTILQRLKLFSGQKLKAPFINCVENACNLKKYEGLKWLSCVSELLENDKLKMELPKGIIEKLPYHIEGSNLMDTYSASDDMSR